MIGNGVHVPNLLPANDAAAFDSSGASWRRRPPRHSPPFGEQSGVLPWFRRRPAEQAVVVTSAATPLRGNNRIRSSAVVALHSDLHHPDRRRAMNRANGGGSSSTYDGGLSPIFPGEAVHWTMELNHGLHFLPVVAASLFAVHLMAKVRSSDTGSLSISLIDKLSKLPAFSELMVHYGERGYRCLDLFHIS
nr:nuclear pore complex protein Nup188a [Ipomoea batatas]